MGAKKLTLDSIAERYSDVRYNGHIFDLGGGLSQEGNFASVRHEAAKYDGGKKTLGEVVQLFKKATGCDTCYIKEVIKHSFQNMEWHHAGRLPKSYGGGMKKTYFLNSQQICELAENWENYCKNYENSLKAKEEKKVLDKKRSEFAEKYAKKFEREKELPAFSVVEVEEMKGRYGWFRARQEYNLPIYYSGYQFGDEQKYIKYKSML